ncbi:site specific recombinase [Legionella spiritensis]|nr:site specific recombinase [Legionella spiritensis]
MMQAKINNTLIKTLVPADKQYDVRDTTLKGFMIRVNPTGKMNFVCQYKRGRRINLGQVGVVTCAQAREKAIEILNLANQGIDPQDNKVQEKLTLEDFLNQHYIPWVKSNHKRSNKTIATILRCFRQFYRYKLIEITPAIIERWRTKRLNSGISNATINRDTVTIRSIITKATEWGFLEINALSKLKALKIDHSPKVRYLSQDEETHLRLALSEREVDLKKSREYANQWRLERRYAPLDEFHENQYYDHLMPMVLISINTGLRQGELFNLTWNMVDLNQKSLIVTGDITKNSSSRYIPLNDEVLAVFQKLYFYGSKKGLVFPSKDNKPFNTVKRSWGTLLKKAKIEQFRWHDLRHHFASKLVMAGVDLNTVRELLGHSDIKTTLRYAHLAPEHKISAVQKICFK